MTRYNTTRNLNIPMYGPDEFDKMIREQNPDTVIVVCQDTMHHYYIVEALKYDRNVLSEKPLTIDETKCREIVQVAANPHLQVPGADNQFPRGQAKQTHPGRVLVLFHRLLPTKAMAVQELGKVHNTAFSSATSLISETTFPFAHFIVTQITRNVCC
jgi:hypothetical protein